MSKARLLKDLRGTSPEFSLDIIENDLMHWKGFLRPGEDTPYHRGEFHLDFRIPEQYPFAPPKVRCITRIFHPNIHFESGEICLDVLKGDWSPAWSLDSICRAILALLFSPNADSPLNCDAGNMKAFHDDVSDLHHFEHLFRPFGALLENPFFTSLNGVVADCCLVQVLEFVYASEKDVERLGKVRVLHMNLFHLLDPSQVEFTHENTVRIQIDRYIELSMLSSQLIFRRTFEDLALSFRFVSRSEE